MMISKSFVVAAVVCAASAQTDDFTCPDEFLGYYPHLYRLYGTYADPEDCGVFWNCQDGKANRYECPPGLAFSQDTHGCLWASEVPECSGPVIAIDEEGGEFACPERS